MREAMVMAMAAVLVGGAAPSLAGPNANTTLVLHALETQFGLCGIDDPCLQVGGPSLEIAAPGESHAIYLLLRNYQEVCGVQCAFDWPLDWVFLFALWDCLPSQLSCTCPNGPGPVVGTLASAFDRITGGETAVVGRMHFIPSGSGCISIIESGYPFGTHVIGCQMEIDPVHPADRGRVCVGPGGINACEPAATPVEATTWAAMKAQFIGEGRAR